MKNILAIVFSLQVIFSGCNSKLNKIYEPVFVGRPADNAFNSLVQLPDGELRHYGFEGSWNKPSRHIYFYSKDYGLTWDKKTLTDPDLFTNENMPPAARSPWSGDFIRLISTSEGTFSMRSSNGIDGPYDRIRIDSASYEMIRQPVFLTKTKRMLVTCQRYVMQNNSEVLQSCVFYSDDDGHNWSISYVPVGPAFVTVWPHRKPRWQNYAIEPSLIELSDGRIWMLLRTSMDRFYESFSNDHGVKWSDPVPSRFYGTITMPTLFRMKDGRILLFFCNTTPLPEEDRSADTVMSDAQKTGIWDDVFTNRDVIHAAISDDDGKSWKGFRELYLNPLRNDSDFATRGGKEVSLDKSVHQSQAVELPHGKVLLAFGQHPLVRAMIIFDPDWLLEKSRSDDFSQGLVNWSTFRYINGIRGHCAYNRDPGPALINNPEKPENKVLQIKHILNKELVSDVEGAVWNFPSALKGSFRTKIFLKPGGKGGRISLTDRWFNPTDTMACRYSMYTMEFNGNGNTSYSSVLDPGKWVELTFEWNDLQSGSCVLKINGKKQQNLLPLNFTSVNGISYVQFQSVADKEDTEGYLIESVKALSDPGH